MIWVIWDHVFLAVHWLNPIENCCSLANVKCNYCPTSTVPLNFYLSVNWSVSRPSSILYFSPHVRESKTVLDYGFHAVDSVLQLLDSKSFSVELGFRIPRPRIPQAKLPRFRIPHAKIFRILESGVPYIGLYFPMEHNWSYLSVFYPVYLSSAAVTAPYKGFWHSRMSSDSRGRITSSFVLWSW